MFVYEFIGSISYNPSWYIKTQQMLFTEKDPHQQQLTTAGGSLGEHEAVSDGGKGGGAGGGSREGSGMEGNGQSKVAAEKHSGKKDVDNDSGSSATGLVDKTVSLLHTCRICRAR